ncbi:MAG: 30S ribosomal protein S1 [Alkalibacterium sp.]|uniref:Small subunit ribosomal protein S1 n=1 Tax=Alkalibacterium gilvum TaxID=1130080 RepID=A0A1H6QWV2_9LACT|nr:MULTISPECIES: 30S ribosomal protein S1 [Alkalibacterium]MDN6193886.1 30S ribosomal protein S1 [Alkalibacterium sp.]MDN6293635.1 30S ribosomal protein S1 [Alkalibacterium sp.]MDN6295369.1 30S ribosomal protein S1 [Alkalibacterium sp.]MDN6326644.1 30S ribosomal protein S1 [Alkalibacterium sp.]MDN6385266.1 30S ribosomal protein S1 [Alkalibacterium sp.]
MTEENRNEVTEEEAVEAAKEQVQVDTPDDTTAQDVFAENEKQQVQPAVEIDDAASGESMSDVMRDVDDITPGDLVKGEVLTIDNDKQVIVGLEGGQEGVIPPRELSTERFDKPSDVVSIGETIDVVVLRDVKDKEQGSFILSKKRVDQRKVWEELQQKYDNNEVIEATVSRVVKGGLTIDLGVRGFVPASQIDTHFVSDLNQFEGNTYNFKIIEIDPKERQLILSRKVLLEKERAAEREEALEKLEEGSVVEGEVVRLTNFGAFVNVGGVDGLVHISEIAHERIASPKDKLSKGDKVEVKVLKVDKEQERVSLSIKETLPGPWDNIEEELPAGSVTKGTVKRVTDFGAFVEVKPGVEGLVHISEMAHKHVETPHEVVAKDEELDVKVLSVKPDEERISLSIKALKENPNESADTEKPKAAPKKKAEDKPEIKQPALRDEDDEGAFTLGDQIGDQLSGFMDEDDEE